MIKQVITFFLLCVPMDAQSENNSINRQFEPGWKLLDEMKYQKALEYFKQAEKEHPLSAEAYCGRGNAYYWLREHAGAIADHHTATELDPGYVEAYQSLAYDYLAVDFYEEAVTAINKAIQLDPNNMKLVGSRAFILLRKGDHDEAFRDFDELIRQAPQDAATYADRAEAYQKIKKFDLAVKDYLKAMDLAEEKQPSATYSREMCLYGLSDCYENLGQFWEAISVYGELLEIKSKNAAVWSIQGNCYYELGEYERALAAHNESLRLEKTWTSHHHRGDAYAGLEAYDKAIADYTEAIKLSKSALVEASYLRRIECYEHLGQYAKALEGYDYLIKHFPKNRKRYEAYKLETQEALDEAKKP